MLVNLNNILPQARTQGYAIGAFNTSNLEITQAIVHAAEALQSPVIIATSEKAIAYAGIEHISYIVKTMAKNTSLPVVLHLDHGSSFEMCQECIRHGYTSVMIDASKLNFAENVKITKKVVNYAHQHNVSVEAEIGRLAGIEDDVKVNKDEAIYTDPIEAKKFADESGCDALAIAIGTSHGAYKFKGKAKLRIDILQKIAEEVEIPLVLHGASAVKARWVDHVNKFGGKLEHAKGVPDDLITQAVKHGIAKINTDTDLRIAFTAGIREYLHDNPEHYDPRKIIARGRDMIIEAVKERIVLFGSAHNA
jgi:fructose-bisphosphate aldolase class II